MLHAPRLASINWLGVGRLAKRIPFFASTAVPAVLAALLFFMSGGDIVILTIAFILLVWSFFATRYHVRHPITIREVVHEAETPDYLRAGLQWCLAMSGAKRVLLWRIEESTGLVRPVGVAGGAAPSPHILHASPIQWLARERVSARIDPIPDWSVTDRVIGVPLQEEVPRHLLTIELMDDIEVKPDQFEALGIYMGALMNVIRDHELLGTEQERTENLLSALRALPSATTLEQLGRELAGAAIRICNANGAALSVWDGEKGTVSFSEGGGAPVGTTFTGVDSLTSLAARNGAIVQRDRAGLRSVRVLAEKERFTFTPHVAAAIPLMNGGVTVAMLTVWSADRIPEVAITALETIAPFAARQVEHAGELGMMRHLAERDGLTGLHNRRGFDQQLEAEIARFERYRRPFALIMMDLDHFKKVNDQYGHEAGDEVLRRVGQIIEASLRDVDVAGRFGGEEFALLLPETDKSDAVAIAERIRQRVEAADIVAEGHHIRVTSSAGVAAIPEKNVDVKNVLRIADQLLYDAKHQGRNRVVTIR